MRRLVIGLTFLLGLSGCGSAVAAGYSVRPAASPSATASAALSRTSVPTDPAATAPPAAPVSAPAAPPPPPPQPRVGTFVIEPVGGSSLTGVIRVTALGSGGFQAVVSLRGFPTGMVTVHTVHVHQGSCRSPYAGPHLYVLGLLTASASGSGTLATVRGAAYVAGSRYLIVYSTEVARTIVGCANLGPLA